MAHHAHQSHRGPSIPAPVIPAGTFPPGTLITVGAHKCTIDRYLSEGGFAHVYLVKLSKPINGSDVAVLKRVAVPDKEALASMRTEVETMKRLRGHRHIVTYIDSHASHLQGGGYEVFLLMEFCSGGGLIDFMNTRLQHRLTEPEVLRIFDHVTEGVACMHYLQPALLHRDLKVENVLIASNGIYKLCDFGSCSIVKPAPQSVVECRLLEEDIQKHTTLQYRSPEMIDVYRRVAVDEKSDIWALGVLLYKLCYYTTPFEEQGQLAIMNASFAFPPYPHFSDRLKNLIASMLREQPQKRPNIFQVVQEVCHMRGKECPIKDIYSKSAIPRPVEKHTPALPIQSPPSVVAYEAPVQAAAPALPDIAPMRRGRPIKASAGQPIAHSASTSQTRLEGRSPHVRPTTADPFAALDSNKAPLSQDDLSARFPSVEQFSLLHDSGSKFQFPDGQPSPTTDQKPNESHISKLAEDAFASVPPQASARRPTGGNTHKAIDAVQQALTGNNRSSPVLYEPQPNRPTMVSTGTMTSPSPEPVPKPRYEHVLQSQELTAPSASSKLDRKSPVSYLTSPPPPIQHRPHLLETNGRSSTYSATGSVRSSRPSLEATRDTISAPPIDPMVRSKSALSLSRPRPHSVYVESNLEFLRDLESPSTQGPPTGDLPSLDSLRINHSGQSASSPQHTGAETHIESDVGYLRAMEKEEENRPDKRLSGSFVAKHVKRASLPSISLPKTGKNKLGGKFGDAFRRFERGGGNSGANAHETSRSPSPELAPGLMPTIDGSQATSDAGDEWEVSSQEVPPEVRRELEKRQLAAEERRVAAAAAEYKRQVANRDLGGDSAAAARPDSSSSRKRANSIQKRVHNLLSENKTKPPPPKTAEGYGRYTTEPAPQDPSAYKGDSYRIQSSTTASRPQTASREPPRPIPGSTSAPLKIVRKLVGSPPSVAPPSAARPTPPPKPNKLRTGGSTAVPNAETPARQGEAEDWERNFAKRYPSVTGLEMVETVVAGTGGGKV